ncbi:hypothetical protein Z043_110191 [Scleropages formosus]|uniref:Uncharacterized protein n=1 Tax=Scleropages formosus TaxID=113540 RepID=A0A0P7UAJ7_SCLFO|nr:hypothetical protein Z043_110191 [Scleropages formosus]
MATLLMCSVPLDSDGIRTMNVPAPRPNSPPTFSRHSPTPCDFLWSRSQPSPSMLRLCEAQGAMNSRWNGELETPVKEQPFLHGDKVVRKVQDGCLERKRVIRARGSISLSLQIPLTSPHSSGTTMRRDLRNHLSGGAIFRNPSMPLSILWGADASMGQPTSECAGLRASSPAMLTGGCPQLRVCGGQRDCDCMSCTCVVLTVHHGGGSVMLWGCFGTQRVSGLHQVHGHLKPILISQRSSEDHSSIRVRASWTALQSSVKY